MADTDQEHRALNDAIEEARTGLPQTMERILELQLKERRFKPLSSKLKLPRGYRHG